MKQNKPKKSRLLRFITFPFRLLFFWVMPLLNLARRTAEPAAEKTFAPWMSKEEEEVRDFVADADWVRIQQEPLHARSVLRVMLAIGILLLVWAALAHVDEITRGEGKVIPSQQLQVVQSLDGGIVSKILVKEGDVVDSGQVLVRIDQTRALSNLRESRATYLSLLVKAARLKARAEAQEFEPPAEAVADAPDVVEQERGLFQSKRSELSTEIGIAQQQMAQRSQELNETRARREQAAQSYRLVSQELEMTRPLLASGAVSDVDLLRLEREAARLKGDRDGLSAQIGRLQSAIGEARRKVKQVELDFRNRARSELSETNAKLNSISEGSVALSDKVEQTAIKSPMRGTVKRLMVNTVGGVIQPGKDILEIVPLEDNLFVEARIQPRDIAFLRPGQKAMVRFTAYDFSIYGGLQGSLENIGADTVTDEKGNAYYIVRVRTAKPDFGRDKPIIPGMMAEVDIVTGRKTVLSYLLKPILRAKVYALSER